MPLRACRPSERQMWTGPDWDRPGVDGRGSRLGRPCRLLGACVKAAVGVDCDEVPAVRAEPANLIGVGSQISTAHDAQREPVVGLGPTAGTAEREPGEHERPPTLGAVPVHDTGRLDRYPPGV